IQHNGDPKVLQIQEVPQPKPGPGEALIHLKAAGLNYIDIYYRAGILPTPLPYIPGLEGAGIVEAIGEGVVEVKVGDRVAYTGTPGSYAEYNVVKAKQLIPLPDDISFEQGAAFPLQGMTAHYLSHDFYHINPGDYVLVHAAAGGVGLQVVQWLKRMGAHVIGTVSNNEKALLAKEAGAEHTIIYTKQDFVAEVKKLTEDKGVHYIIDGVGKSTFTKNLDAVRTHGWICIFGMSSGPAEPFAPNLLQPKSLTVCGGMLSNHTYPREVLLKRANEVIDAIREGWLQLRVDHVLPLEQAAKAHELLESRQTAGKVILQMNG
ncbi:MAG: quinone oxidoreductase family protein, partial [Legionellales bacterium]